MFFIKIWKGKKGLQNVLKSKDQLSLIMLHEYDDVPIQCSDDDKEEEDNDDEDVESDGNGLCTSREPTSSSFTLFYFYWDNATSLN